MDAGASPLGLCPTCLLEVALDVTSLETEQIDRGEAPTVAMSGETLVEGQIQGERYRIRSLLGRGGMGEVWRAYDLKLRQDVALKSLLTEQIADAGALEMLRQEVRVAREVISPNVCRVFDLQEVDGQELVSMEYIDGTTLAEILEERSPLELDEAREIASQFLAGLEAVHDAGLVHRDIKPENIMLTRTGRVVVMDFGIAKALQEGKGSLAGTPAYMSPEQARAGELDARSDVFSAGIVLAEMVAPGGVRSRESRREVLEGIHRAEPAVAETPWSRVITRCMAAQPEERFPSAAELARALEEVTLRAADEEVQPYPGLSAFQEEDARFFFGRELEVEALWKKLRRPHLLAVIGPSGAGKSSFLRAGLLPTLTDGWQAIVATPGDRPFANLAQALARKLGDTEEAAELLPRFDEPAVAVELLCEWRGAHDHTLVIVDQFEELFTQNPPEVQSRFAELLGRLPLEADVHVLLSMRDDFLLHCQTLEPLAPLFSEMTPLGPPTGASLRRAIVQPALKCGYRFESESLVESMLAEVEGERGALPLLAFAARQLWQSRDRDTGLLSEEAYASIGGVGGALAQHAERTLDSIGEHRVPIVRELFRNLVTAEGTRAARDREDLLSVFKGRADGRRPTADGRAAATEVLDALIDARLLTSFEVARDDAAPAHRIEIVHESLLSAWPRLVRWQAQDADSARMRDQLRQAARIWTERGRPDDLLWSGTAFKEYELWRERYEGGLSADEGAFATAMSAKALRGRRRRRIALSAIFAALLIVLAVVGASRQQAVVAARRAEASKLLALGRLELEDNHTAALAYAAASLALEDLPETRLFALEALWRGPTYFALPETGAPPTGAAFSHDERWLAVGYMASGEIRLWPRDGGAPTVIQEAPESTPDILQFAASSDRLVSAVSFGGNPGLRIWAVPGGRLERRLEAEPDWPTWGFGMLPLAFDRLGERLFTFQFGSGSSRILEWPLDEELPNEIGIFEGKVSSVGAGDSQGRRFWAVGGEGLRDVFVMSLQGPGAPEWIHVGRQEGRIFYCDFDETGLRIACNDRAGVIRVWSIQDPAPESPLLRLEGPAFVWPDINFDASGRTLASGHEDGSVCVWDLNGPPAAEALTMRFESGSDVKGLSLQQSGRWVAAVDDIDGGRLWPLSPRYPAVIQAHTDRVLSLDFSADGSAIVSSGYDGARRWPLAFSAGAAPSESLSERGGLVALDPMGRFVLMGHILDGDDVEIVPLGEGSPDLDPIDGQGARAVAVSHDGRLAAWGGRQPSLRVITVWNLETGGRQVLDLGPEKAISALEFTPQGELLAVYTPPAYGGAATSLGGLLLRKWDLEDESHEVLLEEVETFDLSADGRSLLALEEGRVVYRDLEQGSSKELLALRAEDPAGLALDPGGTIAALGTESGVVRVAVAAGGPAHLLVGHEAAVGELAFSPDGQWLATGDNEGTIRLWPMPDLSRPPLHRLPLEDLLARLRSLTNLRAVRNPESSTGWSIEIGPFPGWAEVPAW